MNPITVLLAEDHTIVREGLRVLLNQHSDLHIVGEVSNGRDAVNQAAILCPDVVLMDIAMPLLNGLEATRQILRATPDAKILVLSAYNDKAQIAQVVELGARGFIVKQSASSLLHKALREVHQGGTFFSINSSAGDKPPIPQLIRAETAPTEGTPSLTDLTSREVEVLQLVAEGKPNKETANELRISVKTVEKHRQSLMKKLDIHDTAGLTRYAITAGIIESSAQTTIL